MIGKADIGVECVQQLQTLRWAMYHRRRDRVIQCDHWVVGHPLEQIVEREDLWPIGVAGPGRLIVNSGDGSLQLVWTDGAFWQRGREQCDSLCDLSLIPERPVLLRERDHLASGIGSCKTASIG